MKPDDDLSPATTDELLRFLDNVPANGGSRGPGDAAKRSSTCPAPSAYMGVILGSCERSEGQALLDHAAACSSCAQALAASLRALEGDPTADEINALAGLPTTQPQYQREISAKLADSRAGRKPFLKVEISRPMWWIAAAAAILIAATVSFLVWKQRANAPERLLARAYQSSRTLELRIPGAGFSALKAGAHTRGNDGGEEAPALLEARAALARKLEQTPQDDRSLHLSARADLLEEHYDTAIDKLDRLIAKGPVTAELLTDAATAYFERGLVTGRELDRMVALDHLHQAELLAPSNPVVLFNEAIVMEDRGQLLNAAETWKRYLTQEHDPEWAAEGKRRQAALQTTLDRLKSHESRLLKMLSSPEAMDALASDAARLAQWDEELSSVELDKLTIKAFPLTAGAEEADARASPCEASCLASRRLLYAVAFSLKQHHRDEWLSDLFPSSFLPPSFEALPPQIQMKYAQAMHLLGDAVRQNQTDQPEKGESESSESRRLFLEIVRDGRGNEQLRTAGEAGAWRAAAEYIFSLQRTVDFAGCRAFAAAQLKSGHQLALSAIPRSYPWIGGLFGITAKICSDTPETRENGETLGAEAMRLATDAHYRLLASRIQLHTGSSVELFGDRELSAEQFTNTLRELLRADPPLIRIVNTQSTLTYLPEPSWKYVMALSQMEALGWSQLAGDRREEIFIRMQLGLSEISLGRIEQAQAELRTAQASAAKYWPGERVTAANNNEILTDIAETWLEQGELTEAQLSLEALHEHVTDSWILSKTAEVGGQIQLEQRNYAKAEQVLETQIRLQEGTTPNKGKPAGNSIVEDWGLAGQDHDLYAELAAAWLADGRPPMDVLALWERFRLRLQGLPVRPCLADHLNCEREALEAEQKRMGPNLLTGEIVLMDRVLVYEMDSRGVRWSTRKVKRQDMLSAAQALEWAASSPSASATTVQTLGKPLAEELLPPWRQDLPKEASLFLEPDPLLHNLAWSTLPTARGALGLDFAVAELPSILAHPAMHDAGTRRISAGATANDWRVPPRPLVIGASVVGEKAPPLPEAVEEARRVATYLHAPELLLGSQATAQNVAAGLPHASLLHFAGHALQDDWGTRLLLAHEPGADAHADAPIPHPWVDETFLRDHPPRACRLAVLSACATGGNTRAGTAPLRDMTKILYSLGVPEVVATRWPVDSEASVTFMKAFYGSIESGQDVAHALRAARMAQSNNGAYGNPYFWGAYYVTGREELSSKREPDAKANNRDGQSRREARQFQEGR